MQPFDAARSCLHSAIRVALITFRMARLKHVSALLGAEARANTEGSEKDLGSSLRLIAICGNGTCSCRADLGLDLEEEQVDVR